MVLPFKKIVKLLGQPVTERNAMETGHKLAQALKVRDAVMMCTNNVPWSSVCLDQAIATAFMLNSRNIRYILHFGVLVNDEAGKLQAHAWIECNNNVLIGGEHSKEYSSVVSFQKNSNARISKLEK